MSNTFGNIFCVTTFGESHGLALGCVIDGCPPNIPISVLEIQKDLDARRPGQSYITTDRKEEDVAEIISGVFEQKTTGTPICILINNENHRSQDYSKIKDILRPSHADYTYLKKYGIRDYKGGGRASARETVARVAAGAIAKKVLAQLGVEVYSYVEQVYNIKTNIDPTRVTKEAIEANIVRCPDEFVAAQMIELISSIKEEGDSVGGIIRGIIKNCPEGLGAPVFDKLHADLGKAMLGINAVKGFDIGSGFEGINLKGSEHNDEIFVKNNKISTKTNHAGGIVGGISNGENIIFRVAFKPVSSIKKPQSTIDIHGNEVQIDAIKGRHDPCVLPRAVPIVDAMGALVVLDHLLLNKTLNLL